LQSTYQVPSLSSSTRQRSRPNRAARRNALSSSGVAIRIRHQGSTDVALDPDIRAESLARDVAALDSEECQNLGSAKSPGCLENEGRRRGYLSSRGSRLVGASGREGHRLAKTGARTSAQRSTLPGHSGSGPSAPAPGSHFLDPDRRQKLVRRDAGIVKRLVLVLVHFRASRTAFNAAVTNLIEEACDDGDGGGGDDHAPFFSVTCWGRLPFRSPRTFLAKPHGQRPRAFRRTLLGLNAGGSALAFGLRFPGLLRRAAE
jgi:hypothetical protein